MPESAGTLFLLSLFLSFFHIEARESMFFNKAIHYAVTPQLESPSLAPSQLNILTPALPPAPNVESPGPAQGPVQGEYGYGLYGRDADLYPSTTTTGVNVENKFSSQEFHSKSYKDEYNSAESYNNNGYFNNNEAEAGYSTPLNYNTENNNYNKAYSTSSNYNNKNHNDQYSATSTYNYNNNGFSKPITYNNDGFSTSYSTNNADVKNESQGSSNTNSFDDNYNYHINVNNDNYNPHIYASSNNREGYVEKRETSKYEFDSMEEYDKQQGYLEEYTP